ncbi:MAG: YceI family protein [Candidatus Methylomirabilales bacterium]
MRELVPRASCRVPRGGAEKRTPLSLLVALLWWAPVIASAAEYAIQPESSEFVVRLYKAGIGSALAHDHVVRATRFSGTVMADDGNPGMASVQAAVQADSLRADEPEMRRKHRLSGELSEKDRREIQSSMMGQRQLDAARFPTITFRSVSVQPEGTGRAVITGDFTLHGTTRRVTFPATVQLSGDSLHATGSFDFNQTDFGIQPYSAFLGAVRNQDRVTLIFDVQATRR